MSDRCDCVEATSHESPTALVAVTRALNGLTTYAAETLEFEEPIAVLLKEIEALSLLPQTDAREREIESLRRRVESIRGRALRRRSRRGSACWWRGIPSRPGLEDFIERLFTGFVEIHGDRRFADDHAIMTGFADYKGQPVLLVGHVKGGDTKEKIYPQFRLRPARGLSQGAARDAAGREVQPADHRLRRHAGRLSRASSRRSAASPRPLPSTCAR